MSRLRLAALSGAALTALVATACADGVAGAAPAAPAAPLTQSVATFRTAAPSFTLGNGFVTFPDAATQWVQDHPDDSRTPTIKQNIVGKPTSMWLTGNESFGNLSYITSLARAQDRTAVFTLYNIPNRYDGLSAPTDNTAASYKTWIDRVSAGIGNTRTVLVVEPDALWFYDRMYTDADRVERMKVLNYAVNRFRANNPRTRVYLDAGTSSGSVTPARMAAILVKAGMGRAAGFAVNVSSYSPSASINAYAQAVRSNLRQRGIANPRYVIDTGRNGASTWDNNWCNPPEQKLGNNPRLVRSSTGLDMNLWVKAPATSDGDCGPVGGGQDTYGGEFMPNVAVSMSR